MTTMGQAPDAGAEHDDTESGAPIAPPHAQPAPAGAEHDDTERGARIQPEPAIGMLLPERDWLRSWGSDDHYRSDERWRDARPMEYHLSIRVTHAPKPHMYLRVLRRLGDHAQPVDGFHVMLVSVTEYAADWVKRYRDLRGSPSIEERIRAWVVAAGVSLADRDRVTERWAKKRHAMESGVWSIYLGPIVSFAEIDPLVGFDFAVVMSLDAYAFVSRSRNAWVTVVGGANEYMLWEADPPSLEAFTQTVIARGFSDAAREKWGADDVD